MTVALLILSALAALTGAAFFAGAETGFLSVSRERVLHLAREGGLKAKIIQTALADMGRTTTLLLIGNNLASVAYSASTAALSALLLSNSMAKTVWGFFAAFLVLYVSEFLPKLLFAARPLRRMLKLARTYRVVEVILSPLTGCALALTNVFVPARRATPTVTSADLLRILEDRKDGVCLSDIESALIGRIVTLRLRGEAITPEALSTVLLT